MEESPTGEIQQEKSTYGVLLRPDNDDKFPGASEMPEMKSEMHFNLSDALLSSVGTPGDSSYFFFKVSTLFSYCWKKLIPNWPHQTIWFQS